MIGDITKPKEVDAIVKSFMKHFGKLDILVTSQAIIYIYIYIYIYI